MIALITDFGTTDHFIGVVKGVIKKINPDTEIIDICHYVSPQSITNAQFILKSSYPYFPQGTIFYVVVDPGVGSDRKILIIKKNSYYFVMPDNGIISALEDDEIEVWKADISKFKNISNTFHGRDIFAPLAAQLSLGQSPDELGQQYSKTISKPFPDYHHSNNIYKFSIIHIDKFGNLITSLPSFKFDGQKKSYIINFNKKNIEAKYVYSYSELNKNEIGIIKGSSDFIELTMNQNSIANKLNIKLNCEIEITYE